MNILVIHAISDKERHENILTQFAMQSTRYNYQVVPAIMNPSQPPVGICRSFKKCVEIARKNSWPEVCILEDDVKFLVNNSLQLFFDLYYNVVKPSYECLFLGGIYEGDVSPVYDNVENNIAWVKNKLSGLHAMIVPQALYQTILDAEEPYHLDYYLSMEKKVPIMTAYPLLIVQNDGWSYNANQETFWTQELHRKYKFINNQK